jgi:UDP:flavonoid glycosyltransferase YjiC (YdhE family)
MTRDLERYLRSFGADATVGDPAVLATTAAYERGGPPAASYQVTVLGLSNPELPPFGLGLRYGSTAAHRLRNRAAMVLARRVVFRAASRTLRAQYRQLGLRERDFAGVPTNPCLMLQPTVPALEYPCSTLPPQLHFVGALLPEPPIADLPGWWSDLDDGRPVVVVTQGTVATNAAELIAPALAGLADRDLWVVAAGVKDRAALGRVPGNARLEAFVPFTKLLPRSSALVTNGGYGGVLTALSNGVPVVCAGTTEDKPEVANRVAYAGVGVNLRTNRPSPSTVAAAVDRVLAEPRFRQRAQAMQAELAAHDAPVECADLLERLVMEGRPVLPRG